MKKIICVYKITSPSKKIYIGSTVNYRRRIGEYKRMQNKMQVRLYSSLRKYGFDKHKIEIICECSLGDLRQKEAYYGALYNSLGKHGLNCALPKHGEGFDVLSDETRKKISIGNRGKIMSEETKAKMRARTYSKELREKMGLSRLGKVVSEETRKKISDSNKGKKPSEETRRKQSAWQIGRKMSEETRIKMSLAKKGKNLGKKPSEDARAKMSLAALGRKPSEEARMKMSLSAKGKGIGRKASAQTRMKISLAGKGRVTSDETRRKLSEARVKHIILNTQTGIYYFGVTEAAKSIGSTKSFISHNLFNYKINKTDFIIA